MDSCKFQGVPRTALALTMTSQHLAHPPVLPAQKNRFNTKSFVLKVQFIRCHRARGPGIHALQSEQSLLVYTFSPRPILWAYKTCEFKPCIVWNVEEAINVVVQPFLELIEPLYKWTRRAAIQGPFKAQGLSNHEEQFFRWRSYKGLPYTQSQSKH